MYNMVNLTTLIEKIMDEVRLDGLTINYLQKNLIIFFIWVFIYK